jgi:exopolyphosphatase/guanosine-5'-triphosphate,3'-diphosphate pyrophosphatase
MLFDSAKRIHRLGAAERELLECAALLHDVGASVNPSKHHRRSRYLILNSSLPGFQREEVQWIATIARFHRGTAPKPTHPDLAGFDPQAIRRIICLAAILRIADSLDRSHRSVVRSFRSARHGGRVLLELDVARTEAALELWAARRKAYLWERVFGMELGLRVRPRSGRIHQRGIAGPHRGRTIVGARHLRSRAQQ